MLSYTSDTHLNKHNQATVPTAACWGIFKLKSKRNKLFKVTDAFKCNFSKHPIITDTVMVFSFWFVQVLMISPQNLGEDLVQLLAHTNLRHLHIIQNRYTPGEINIRPVPGKIWKQCRHLNSSLAVHLEVKGARNGNVLWQERAPVRSLLYDSRYIKVQTL